MTGDQRHWGVFRKPASRSDFRTARASACLPRDFSLFVSEHESFDDACGELDRLGLRDAGFVRALVVEQPVTPEQVKGGWTPSGTTA